ncbi:hypothetical protein T12_8740, partial [Trichinella patagoniensis]
MHRLYNSYSNGKLAYITLATVNAYANRCVQSLQNYSNYHRIVPNRNAALNIVNEVHGVFRHKMSSVISHVASWAISYIPTNLIEMTKNYTIINANSHCRLFCLAFLKK